jgi:RimJ/RimL family protein N-acetyltransferase
MRRWNKGELPVDLETGRMVLRDFAMTDLEDFHEIFSNPIVMAYIEPVFTLERSRDFLQSFCVDAKKAFAAVLKETGKVIGYILFKEADTPGIYEIGWIFNEKFWRMGYTYEICNKLISYGFEDMRLHKIIAEGIEIKSISLMKKLGMVQEGIQRKHNKYNNDWVDLHWYGILEDDYF